jgi:hypothetical protein
VSGCDSGLFETGEVQIRYHFVLKLVIMLDVRKLEALVKRTRSQAFGSPVRGPGCYLWSIQTDFVSYVQMLLVGISSISRLKA